MKNDKEELEKDDDGNIIKITNAIISGFDIRIECGCLTAWMTLRYKDNRVQGFGGWCLQNSTGLEGPAGYYIMKILQVCNVEDIKDLVGKAIRVKYVDKDAFNRKVYAIGNIIDDDWFDPKKDLFDKMNAKKELYDGIYLVQKDGSKVLFTGSNSDQECKDCKYIGIKLGSKAVCVALNDAAKENTPLTSENDTTKGYDNYIDSYLDAIADWNGKENTEHLKQIGLCENIHLEDGEYIPSVGELLFIQLFRKQIQAALRYVDGKLLPDVWYWTSTEASSSNAWYLYLYDGSLGNWYDKATDSNHVRAVSAF